MMGLLLKLLLNRWVYIKLQLKINMNKIIKSLLAVALVALNLTTYATDYSGAITTGNTRIFSGPGKLTVISITASSAAAITINFYDAATNQVVYTNAAYTTVASYVTNLTTYYTNTQGYIQTNTRSALWNYESSVAADTNVAYPIIASVTVPASATVTKTFSPYLNISRGLTARTSGTNATANISYIQ